MVVCFRMCGGKVASSSNRDLINDLLVELRDGLGPVVERVLGPLVPANRLWTAILEERDRVGDRPVGRYSRTDLQSMLSAMTGRLGTLGYPFSPVLGSRANQLLPEELRKVRNDWAHIAEFSDDETDRAFASGSRLLRAVGADEQAERVDLTLNELRRARYGSGAAPVPARGGAVLPEPTPAIADQPPVAAEAVPSSDASELDAPAVTIEVDALDVL